MSKLKTVEAARGLAALGVVLFHANASMHRMGQPALPVLPAGEAGVDFFFVLSGFIITYVHGRDVGHPHSAPRYTIRRFLRLFPMLWVVVGSWLLFRAQVGHLSAPVVGTSLLLYPSITKPEPLVVWTLRHELIFYLAFLVLIIEQRVGWILFGAWAALCELQLALSVDGNPITGLPAFFLSTFNLDFMLGMVVAHLHTRVKFNPAVWPLVCAMASVVVVLSVRSTFHETRLGILDYVSIGATVWTLIVGLSFAFLLHGLLRAEPKLAVPNALVLLGACSYSLYLVHTPLNAFTQHVGVHLPIGISDLFLAVAAVAAGLFVHLFIERPMGAALKQALARRRIAV